MKVVLVNPPDITVARGISSESRFFMGAPLSLAYLAAVLEAAEHEVEIIDCVGSKLDWNHTCARLEKSNPDLVGITTLSVTLQSAVALAKKSKEYFPEILVVFGGHGVFRIQDTVLGNVKEVDLIVRGEGERTIVELAKTIAEGGSLNDVLGISFRSKKGKIVNTPDRPFIEDLDSIPFPARHLLPIETYMKENPYEMGREFFLGTSLISSRGCLFACTFCQATRFYGHCWRYRSAKNVVDEIEHLYETYGKVGLTGFAFSDDDFLANRKRAMEICDLIIERGLDHLHWYCQARVTSADKILYSKLYDAGCRILGFGVESGDDRVLKIVQKGITKDMVRKAVKMAKDAGLLAWGYFMFGLPGDTEESMMNTLMFSEELDLDDALYSIAVMLPGSEMGREKEVDWLNFIVENELARDPNPPNVMFIMKLHPCAPTYADREEMIKVLNYLVKHRLISDAKKKKKSRLILRALRNPRKAVQMAIDSLRLDKEKLLVS